MLGVISHLPLNIRPNRRRFLGMGIAAAIAPILLNACSNNQTNTGNRTIRFSHGSGLCNLPLFYASEKQLFEKYGFSGTTALTPFNADIAAQLATGQVEMAVIPFTNAIAAYTQGASFQVVAGSGIEGLIVVAKPEFKSFQDLKGRKIGTFQADTLDIIVYDYLQRENMSYSDVEMVYFGDSTEVLNAYLAGQVDAISSIEPYATKARTSTNGNVLGDGTDIYGAGYPDCVVAARNELIQNEPEVVKNVIRTFFEAQYLIENNFEEAAQTTIDKYYKTDMASLLQAAQAQPPGVDIRGKRDFMYSRAESMMALNYINQKPDENFVNFSLLEQVIQESPELWQRVRVKTEAA
ncbi:ABC transporter substrate-binding protein [Chroococcidiopsis sp. TS-821]|uniref:ABC transporter substrate-binding protein n=1 Tax=Chroococcidiopsis sp. TS-821 TaxID=1378066 RepID=UPI000CEEADC1|nr:ABC transporter substrate-binding protein [Chroococcidiopsis sp. TS-821]PPS40968.1 nitrate ABC transporter substrate-binding protein [Chroococcidiopsis sp. TS-821]